MKHVISILFAVLLATTMQAQLITDFEAAAGDAGWDAVSSCTGLVVENPYQTGLNMSCRAYKLQRAAGDSWSGMLLHLSSLMSGNYVHILMYRDNNTNLPNLKVSDTAVGGVTDLVPVAGTTIVANQWQDIVFDVRGYSIDFIFIMPDRNGTATIYVDDILLSEEATPRTTPNECVPPTQSEDDYVLVWNEDFTDGPSLDDKNWNIETTANPANNELQYYSSRGVSIEANPYDGKQCLVLTARKENMGGRQCTSGRVTTENKVTYTYGKIEARIKFPHTANGLWPAFWQMGNDIGQVGWPRCGETDFIELGHQNAFSKNTQDRYFNGAMHLGSAWNTVWSEAKSSTWPYSVEDTFHIVTCYWTPTSMKMYMDEASHPENGPYFEAVLEPNPDGNNYYDRQIVFGKPNFVLLNLAIGGDFPGIRDVNKVTALANGEKKMYIDWVRVYQKAGEENLVFRRGGSSDEIEEADPNWQLQGVEQNFEALRPEKQLHNGSLIIVRGDARYDVLGHRLY